jgi:hypothetical protein
VITGAGSTVSGKYGIEARNNGSGALTITANGNVTGDTTDGIFAKNYAGATGRMVTTGTGSTVTGDYRGISADNRGSGALNVKIYGNVTATNSYSIHATNDTAGTNLNITTAAGTTVSGATGIHAQQSGTGTQSITANGNVTGTGAQGIFTLSYTGSTTITTGASSTVTGAKQGIFAINIGDGAMSITANGNVTGTNEDGIFVSNGYLGTSGGTDLSVTIGAGTTVTGHTYGIRAYNAGSGATTIKANGNVTGTDRDGVYAANTASATNISVTTAAGTAVSGGTGIRAANSGSGTTKIIANGNVTGTGAQGIDAAANAGAGDVAVTTGTRATILGAKQGIFAINIGDGAMSITANGNVTGTNEEGIYATNGLSGTPGGTDLSVTTGAGSSVTGGTTGILRCKRRQRSHDDHRQRRCHRCHR